MTEDTKPAAIVPDQLIAEAAADAPLPEGAGAAPAAPIDYTAEARGMIDLAIDGLAAVYPSLPRVWSPDVRARVADAAGKVLQKYGIDMAGVFGRFAPELGLAIVLIPLAAPTVAAIRADRAAAAAPPAAAPAASPAAPDADPQPNPLGPFAGGLGAA